MKLNIDDHEDVQDEDEPRVNRRGLQSEGFDLGSQDPVAANDQVLDPMAADHQVTR